MLRDLQRHFTPSNFFAPWIQAERKRRAQENAFQHRRRRDKRVELKIGHGGTLDPLATGVLVTGIGKGTKVLQDFLNCTKTYEAIVLFGVATDSYDRLGKVIGRAPYHHVTREKVEEALKQFRGKYMQMPPIFSSIRIQGKHLYEYARNGEKIPGEIEKRPVNVTEMELLEWYDGGQHDHRWPSEEAETAEKVVAEQMLHIKTDAHSGGTAKQQARPPTTSLKRKRPVRDDDDETESDDSDRDLVFKARNPHKRRHRGPELQMSGGLGSSSAQEPQQATQSAPSVTVTSADTPPTSGATNTTNNNPTNSSSIPSDGPPPPAAKLRMSVSRGFYVRSLCHDLGRAVGSLGIMCELVRTRQGPFELGADSVVYTSAAEYTSNLDPERVEKEQNNDDNATATASGDDPPKHNKHDQAADAKESNVFEYNDLAKGEAVWAPKVDKLLGLWNTEYANRPPDAEAVDSTTGAAGDAEEGPASPAKIEKKEEEEGVEEA